MATLTKRTNGDGLRMRSNWPQRVSETGFGGFDPLVDQIRTMRRVANTLLANGSSYDTIDAGSFPPIEVYERDDSYIVEAMVPGFKRDEIEIDCRDNRCTISGSSERQAVEERLKGQIYQSEFERRDFKRTITLPAEIDADKVSARLQDGVLTITLPTTIPNAAKRVPITA
jgi:HSP20 family protein